MKLNEEHEYEIGFCIVIYIKIHKLHSKILILHILITKHSHVGCKILLHFLVKFSAWNTCYECIMSCAYDIHCCQKKQDIFWNSYQFPSSHLYSPKLSDSKTV